MNPIVIQNMYNQYRHSIMQNLSKAITEICDVDFLWINHFGQEMNRDELVFFLVNGLITYEKWTSDNLNTRVFGDCAILNGTEQVVMIQNGVKTAFQAVVSVTFIKRQAGWKIVSGQSTEIPRMIL